MEELRSLTDSSECSICLEVWTKPRTLPCQHVFCLNCLQRYAFHWNKRPGDCLSCPICRREFQIPNRNFKGLRPTTSETVSGTEGQHTISPSGGRNTTDELRTSQSQWSNSSSYEEPSRSDGGLMTGRLSGFADYLLPVAVVILAVGLGIFVMSKGFRR